MKGMCYNAQLVFFLFTACAWELHCPLLLLQPVFAQLYACIAGVHVLQLLV